MGITELKKLYSRTNAILEGCNKKIGLITNLQLQKLLYLSYGEYFLIGGETLPYLQFEAWKMGPVIREIYNRCRSYGYSSIESLVSYDGSFYVSRDAESVDIAIAKYAKLSIHQLIDHRDLTNQDALLEIFGQFQLVRIASRLFDRLLFVPSNGLPNLLYNLDQ